MIMYISGTDAYKISKRVKDIKSKFHTDVDPSGLNIVDLDNPKPGELRQEIFSSPFLAKRKLIIAKNIFQPKLGKEMTEILEEILEKDSSASDSNIVVIPDILTVKKKETALQKKFKSTKFAHEYLEPKPFEMPAYIANEVAQRKGAISRADAEYLATLIGTDTMLADTELSKLLSLNPTITRPIIDQLITGKFQDDIFALVDAASTGNKKKALQMIEDFFALGNDEYYLFSMILRQWRILLQVKSVIESQPKISSDQIAEQLSIHPYVAKKTLPQARQFSLDRLKSIFSKITEMDRRLKSSFADPQLLIEELVVAW